MERLPGRPAPQDTLIIWRIDRLGRNRRDLIEIATTLQARVGVHSLTKGQLDNTTAHGALVLGMIALMAEYEAALIRERAKAGLGRGTLPRAVQGPGNRR